MDIKILFFSLLADKFGKDEITLSVDHTITLRDLLSKLSSLLGKKFKKTTMISENKLNKYIIAGLNGRDIRQLGGMDTIIKDGDEVSFLPAIAGG